MARVRRTTSRGRRMAAPETPVGRLRAPAGRVPPCGGADQGGVRRSPQRPGLDHELAYDRLRRSARRDRSLIVPSCLSAGLSACRYQYRRCAPVAFNRRLGSRCRCRLCRRPASGLCSVLKVNVNSCLRRAPPSESRPGLSGWGFGWWGRGSVLSSVGHLKAIRNLPVGATGDGVRCCRGWRLAGCAHRQNPDRATPARPRREHHPRPGLCALRSAAKSRIACGSTRRAGGVGRGVRSRAGRGCASPWSRRRGRRSRGERAATTLPGVSIPARCIPGL